jgi:hypothetical protein
LIINVFGEVSKRFPPKNDNATDHQRLIFQVKYLAEVIVLIKTENYSFVIKEKLILTRNPDPFLDLRKKPLFYIFKKSSLRNSSSSKAIHERINKVLQKYSWAIVLYDL